MSVPEGEEGKILAGIESFFSSPFCKYRLGAFAYKYNTQALDYHEDVSSFEKAIWGRMDIERGFESKPMVSQRRYRYIIV